MLVETKGARQWLTELKKRYIIQDTLFRESEEAITILLTTSPTNNMIIGRYCKATKIGVVLDRREEVRNDCLHT